MITRTFIEIVFFWFISSTASAVNLLSHFDPPGFRSNLRWPQWTQARRDIFSSSWVRMIDKFVIMTRCFSFQNTCVFKRSKTFLSIHTTLEREELKYGWKCRSDVYGTTLLRWKLQATGFSTIQVYFLQGNILVIWYNIENTLYNLMIFKKYVILIILSITHNLNRLFRFLTHRFDVDSKA